MVLGDLKNWVKLLLGRHQRSDTSSDNEMKLKSDVSITVADVDKAILNDDNAEQFIAKIGLEEQRLVSVTNDLITKLAQHTDIHRNFYKIKNILNLDFSPNDLDTRYIAKKLTYNSGNKELQKLFPILKTYDEQYLKIDKFIDQFYTRRYAQAKYLYRITTKKELDSLAKFGKFGMGGGYMGYLCLGVSKKAIRRFETILRDTDYRVLIRFEKADIDKYLIHQGYSIRNGHEDIQGHPQVTAHLAEEEHRLPTFVVDVKETHLKIKIYGNIGPYEQKTLIGQYDKLGMIEFEH